ncbi:MAG: hypothetical protein J4N78_13410, partial [Chloroflexi bacterium]|nr:hypothetical protein [Chloroflexota bacterium]
LCPVGCSDAVRAGITGNFKILYDSLLGPSTCSGRTVKTLLSVRDEPFGYAQDRLVEPHFEMGST